MKYIIDAPSNLYNINGTLRVPVKVGEGDLCWYNTYLKAESYTEPDRKVIEDEVWKFVRIITDMTETQRKECFGGVTCDLDDYLTYQEAKSKYEAWLKQKDEIHVGDEVEYEDCKFIVTAEIGNKYHGIHSSNGDIVSFGEGDYCGKDNCKKTGRHFPEVAELLEKMRGEEE